MAQYRTIHELVRDGMFMRVECRKCRHKGTIDPSEIKSYISELYRGDAMLKSYGLQPIPHGSPDPTLRNCLDGVPCSRCRASDWIIDAIKPPKSDADEEE